MKNEADSKEWHENAIARTIWRIKEHVFNLQKEKPAPYDNSVICEEVHKSNRRIQKIVYALYRYNFGAVKYGQTYKALLNGNKWS